ncbi:hypothetical protein BDP55DRAFT_638375 [Colletotrichum godetiae]|uniref:Uncharacterized protein n=1 Tax=Colletotrichum godetiae TaxID=1209918 RepID=A0AAJ0ENR4_9PEZI|nr:uncharacterized protein BDP55DRAFT_638375 [Colletotrichum godetiae]KAK1657857.1 hypothetical protein BDP55DRAFT_638375 [Colletotrichum godetiae]
MGVCWRHIGIVLGCSFCGIASRVALAVRGSRYSRSNREGSKETDVFDGEAKEQIIRLEVFSTDMLVNTSSTGTADLSPETQPSQKCLTTYDESGNPRVWAQFDSSTNEE